MLSLFPTIASGLLTALSAKAGSLGADCSTLLALGYPKSTDGGKAVLVCGEGPLCTCMPSARVMLAQSSALPGPELVALLRGEVHDAETQRRRAAAVPVVAPEHPLITL